jgi:PAS domain S-box-containing protein
MGEAVHPILDSLPQAIFFLDKEFRLSYANRACLVLAGVESLSWKGLPFSGLFPAEEEGRVAERLADLAAGRASEARFRTPLRQAHARPLWVEARVVPVEGAGTALFFAGGLQDLSGLKEAEERQSRSSKEADSAGRELKEFVSIVSHDLKAPLRGISSLAGWIRDDFADRLGEEGRENLDLLVGRAQRMYAMIEGLQRYSKVSSSREARVEVDLDLLLTETVNRFSPPEGVRILKETSFPKLRCERTRLGEVFHSLIGNALKAVATEGGVIRIGACLDEDRWRFWVGDNGRGIPAEHQERIFRLFQKVCPEDEGIGVGLTLARKIVEMDGGELRVESAPGEGAVFSFTVPFGEVPVPA